MISNLSFKLWWLLVIIFD